MPSKIFKVILIGDPRVGKTSIRRQYFGEQFQEKYIVTLGTDFAIKHLNNYILQIWDIAGQEMYHNFRKSYFKGANGAIIVFDVTNSKSLQNVRYWIDDVIDYFQRIIPTIIVGNKIDLREMNKDHIPQAQAKKSLDFLLKEYQYTPYYIETSALTGENIDDLFDLMITQILDFY